VQVRAREVERDEQECSVGVLEGTAEGRGVVDADAAAARDGAYVVALTGQVSHDLPAGPARRAHDDVRAARTAAVA